MVVFEEAIKMTLKYYFFKFKVNILVWIRVACLQNFIILDLVVFDMAMMITLNLFFCDTTYAATLYLIKNCLGWSQMSLIQSS